MSGLGLPLGAGESGPSRHDADPFTRRPGAHRASGLAAAGVLAAESAEAAEAAMTVAAAYAAGLIAGFLVAIAIGLMSE